MRRLEFEPSGIKPRGPHNTALRQPPHYEMTTRPHLPDSPRGCTRLASAEIPSFSDVSITFYVRVWVSSDTPPPLAYSLPSTYLICIQGGGTRLTPH